MWCNAEYSTLSPTEGISFLKTPILEEYAADEYYNLLEIIGLHCPWPGLRLSES